MVPLRRRIEAFYTRQEVAAILHDLEEDGDWVDERAPEQYSAIQSMDTMLDAIEDSSEFADHFHALLGDTR